MGAWQSAIRNIECFASLVVVIFSRLSLPEKCHPEHRNVQICLAKCHPEHRNVQTCRHLPRHSLSTGASREAPVDKRAHQDCNKTRAVSTDTNRKCMKTLFGVHAQVSLFSDTSVFP